MDQWIDAFPALAALDEPTRHQLAAAAQVVTLPRGAAPFRAGADCESYVLVIAGSVRVQMVSEGGREIVLYRVEDGQTCILTTACLMADEVYPAEAIAETPVLAAILPASRFRALVATSAAFRHFVFTAYGRRLADLMALIQEVAFRRIDARLAELLLARVDAAGNVTATHHDLATELGSVREVVSRQLKEFERGGLVRLARGRVTVLDRAGLARVGEGAAG